MKKLIVLGLLALTALSTAYAQRVDADGRFRTRDGQSIIRISVGDSRSDRDLANRVRRLEQAVMDMQNRIYDLEASDTPRTRPVDIFVCSLKTSFDGTFIGKANTKTEAEAITRNNCERGGGSFCSSARVTCERTVEYVNY